MFSHKKRMLNAYQGVYSDFYPVSPEFWCFYPAKVLGLSMIEFEREVPHWKGMLEAYKRFDADGWCIAEPEILNPHVKVASTLKKMSDEEYREQQILKYDGTELERSRIYHICNPSWTDSHVVKEERDLDSYVNVMLSNDIAFNFNNASHAHKIAGEDILIELSLGSPFFDFFEEAMGFENAILFFMSGNDAILEKYREIFLEYKMRLLRGAVEHTDFEAFFIGCSSSCNSLLGPNLWRKWEKPYLKAITEEVHKHGGLIHHHNHGKIIETVPDLVDIGFDCVCPFERAPGDVIGMKGLKDVRKLLDNKVTFNGNVSTVATLINGTAEDVRREVREIREAFEGSSKLIIGSGDQVGSETPEENIWAMIEEGRKQY